MFIVQVHQPLVYTRLNDLCSEYKHMLTFGYYWLCTVYIDRGEWPTADRGEWPTADRGEWPTADRWEWPAADREE